VTERAMNDACGSALRRAPAKLDSRSRTAEIDLALGAIFDAETELGVDPRDHRLGLPSGEKLHEIEGVPAVVQEDATAGLLALETPARVARPLRRIRPQHLPIDGNELADRASAQ